MTYKKIFMRLFLGVEVVIFLANYFFSPTSLQAIIALQKDNKKLEQEIAEIKIDLAQREKSLIEWRAYPFYKEQIAREQLHMARENDLMYYLPSGD